MKRLFALVTLAAATLILVAGLTTVSADDGLVVLSDDVTSQFPDGINFNLSVESPSPVDDIRVFYKSKGADNISYGRLDFNEGVATEGTFFLDTSIGSEGGTNFIPPGTVFRYHYQVFTEDGESFKTEQKEFVYTDSRFEWETMSEGPLTVYYYGPTETRAQLILDASLEATATMSRVLGLEEVEPINIVTYNNYRHMQAALPPRPQTIREGLITQGQAFTDIRVLLVLGTDPTIEGIASHEVTHVLVDDAAGRAYTILPTWLNEGLAEFGNVSPSESYDNALLYGIYTRRVKPLAHLNRFLGEPDDVVIAYGQSRSVISYLIHTYGEDKMAEFMSQLDHTFSVDIALMQVYGFDQDGLDAEWRSRMGLRPFGEAPPESTAQPAPPPAPATAVPTEAAETSTPEPMAGDVEAERRPGGCSRDARVNASSIPSEPFMLLLLAGPVGFLGFRRFRKPPF